jgi:chaperonin GroEL
MGAKEVLFRDAAREKVLRGATALADTVRVTLGPRSRCVLIGRRWGRPLACNDGVTIAREFELRDPVTNLGAQMIRQAAERTAERVGDGTTTATILAQTIFSEGVRNVTAGASAVALRQGLERGLQTALRTLAALARKLETPREKAQVAALSAHNDTTIGHMVAEALERVGPEGAITVEESRTTETHLEVAEGMLFSRGYISPYFVTDPAKMEVILDNPAVLITEKRVSRLGDLLPLLERLAKEGRPLLLVAEDVDGEALATLVVNKLRGVLAAAAVKAPEFGDRRRAALEDMAVLTGGRVVCDELGIAMDKLGPEVLGSVRRVVVTKESTTLVGGAGARDLVAARCEELRRLSAETTSEYDRQKLLERLAKLQGGVAVIRVGAPSETEMQSRKEAFDDAISATKAALSEGVVPGGGLALLRAAAAVSTEAQKCEGDERTGMLIFQRALEAPTRQIALNSAADPGVIVARMMEGKDNLGFDAAHGVFTDLVAAGIIDPAKVLRVALENAVSIAGTLLFTEATLTEEPEKGPTRNADNESSETAAL